MNPLRRVAALATLALATTALVAAPTHAADAVDTHDATLTWGFSAGSQSWGISTTGDVTPVDPVAASDYGTAKGFTLTGGEGSVDAAGTGTVDFTGSVTYSPFASYGALVPDKSTITFADFELDLLSATEGELTAAVSFHKPEGDLAPTRVTVATFDIASLSVTDAGFTLQSAAPDWVGAVPAGTYADGYSDSWPSELVDALRTTVSSPASQDASVYFFRTSTSTANDNKAPAALSAAGTPAAVGSKTLTAVTSYGPSGVTFAVDGSGGFTGTDGNPGDAGIYVGLAPSGGLPDVSSQDAMDSFAAAAFVSTSAVQDGGFATSLTAPAGNLKRGTSYSLYTWRAHGHSTTSQDTETPMTVSWARLTPAIKASVAKKPTTKKAGKLAVAVTGRSGAATGSVTVSVAKAGKPVTAKLTSGKATVTLPKLKKGKWKVSVSYTGSTGYLAARTTTLKVKVKAG